jgi:hypothetical protein
MAMLRIVCVTSSLANYLEGGGNWSVYLQYLLGLIALGHDVLWLELLESEGNRAADLRRIRDFFARMEQYECRDLCALLLTQGSSEELTFEATEAYGKNHVQVREFAQSADLLWNFAAAARQPLLSLFRRRVFIDLDPGRLQVSALVWNLDLGEHHAFLSVGRKLHDPDCGAPTLGLTWHPFSPFVHLPLWPVAPDPGPTAPFSSVTHWNWGGDVLLEGRLVSVSKRAAYLRYLDLPKRCGRPFELAANIDLQDETGDRELLRDHGWRVVHPYNVTGSPEAYRHYIASSRAEVCCPKPIYRELRTGWLSDRSVAYLASGRPVLAEDTGFSEHVPTGEGLLAFQSMDEAIAGVAEIDGNYGRHARVARELAEAHFNSARCLEEMITASG